MSHSTASPEISPRAVVVLGAGGMLGRDVVARLENLSLPYTAYDHKGCDVTEMASCVAAIGGTLPSAHGPVVINCAAYTDVNRAESEEDRATAINGDGAGNVARACAMANARLIHVSTDYVFDGTKAEPYEPADPTLPLNAYGRSKLHGETAIGNEMPGGDWCIVRTSWLYGAHGPNFVKTMLRLGSEGRDLNVINDQVGAPTYTVDLARALVDLAFQACRGVVHATNAGACTWFEFAGEIFDLSGIRPGKLTPCATEDYPTPARRPANSRLSGESLLQCGVPALPPWIDGLQRYLDETGNLPGS